MTASPLDLIDEAVERRENSLRIVQFLFALGLGFMAVGGLDLFRYFSEGNAFRLSAGLVMASIGVAILLFNRWMWRRMVRQAAKEILERIEPAGKQGP